MNAKDLDWTWIDGGPDAQILKYTQLILDTNEKPFRVKKNDPELPKIATAGALAFNDTNHIGWIGLLGDSCHRNTALHEILHLWRWYVEKIPVLRAAPEADARIHPVIVDIDNQIEHSIICPLQITLGHAKSRDYWSALMQKDVDRFAAEPNDIYKLMLLAVHIIEFNWITPQERLQNRHVFEANGYHGPYDYYKKVFAPFSAQTADGKIALIRKFVNEFSIQWPLVIHSPVKDGWLMSNI